MALTESERNRIAELERQVALLMRYMNEKKRQQISFPLDTASQEIIKKL